jgi:WD40 repeat protein
MAPERFAGRSDPRSDVYGLGLTLHELLTLRPAFEAADRGELVAQVLHEEPLRPRKIDPHIPRDLETIVLRATAKEPGRRYASAAEMADDLRRFLDGRPVVARPIGLTERTVKWARRRPAAAVAYGLLGLSALLGGLGAGAVWLWRDAAAARGEAVAARDDTDRQRQLAEDGRAREAGLRAELDRLNGIRQVDLAHRDWLAGDLAAGLGRLDRAARAPGRGWEWGYVYHLYHGGFGNPAVPDLGLAQGITLSPDGRFLAVPWGSRPRATDQLLVWDLATPAAEPAARLHPAARVTACAFHPDGATVYLGTAAGAVERWDASAGKRLDVRTPQDHPVRGLAVGTGGRTIATAGDQGVKLWDWADGREVMRFEEAVPGVLGAFAFTDDWSRLAAPVGGDAVMVWDAKTRAKLLSLPGLPVVDRLDFDPTGRLLAGTSHDGANIWVRDCETGREVFEFKPTAQTLTAGFDAEGRLVFPDGVVVRSWDARSGLPGRTFRGPTGPVQLLAVGGRRVAAVAAFREPFVWDADADPERTTFSSGRRPHGIAVRPGEGGLAVHTRERTVHLRDLATGGLVRKFADHPGDTRTLAVSPDGGLLAVGCADGTVRVWDPDTERLVAERRWPSDGVTALSFSPDGRLLASAGTDLAVRVWDPRSGAVRREWRDVPPWPVALAFSADGRQLSMACGNVLFDPDRRVDRGAIRVFDVESGRVLSAVDDPDLAAMSLEFAPGAGLLSAVGAIRPTIDVWDPATGVKLRTVTGLGARGGRLSFAPDGTRYATTEPGRLRVWDTASDQECLSLWLPDRADVPMVLAFSHDGRRLVVGCRSGAFHSFNAPSPRGDPPPVRTPAAVRPIHGGQGPIAPH